MGESETVAVMAALLSERDLTVPDGRPLYGYRFTKGELEGIGALLRRLGRRALHDRAGKALIVAYVAEWFRRERTGGHWDWIRPLRSIGVDYGPGRAVQYSDVEELVRGGLQAWRRPQPAGGERLLAVVRESGFPVAAVRNDPRIAAWLRHSISSLERGFRVEQAVAAEAWRVSERLAQALYEPAIELCGAIANLRAEIPEAARANDPVAFLDTERRGWRETLPFDVEQEDVRTLVERLVRFREDHSAALNVERMLIRQPDDVWSPCARLELEGELDIRRLPESMASALADGRRLRIFARPPLSRDLIPIGAIESREGEDGRIYEVRPFLTGFEVELPLETEARLLAQRGQNTVGEFVPAGGQALNEAVIALEVAEVDKNERPTRLRVIGPSSCQTSQTWLVLAIKPEAFGSVEFSDASTELGVCGRTGRRLALFSGMAVFEQDGIRWRWRTSAERSLVARPILIGDLLPGVRETVYRGVPRLWVESDGHVVSPRSTAVYWRPRGRGTWRPIAAGPVCGAIDLAVIEHTEVCHSVAVDVVPESTRFEFDRVQRILRMPGLNAPMVAAKASQALQVSIESGVNVVNLGPPSNTPIIVVRPRWETELTLTLADPSYELRLIDEQDRLVNTRAVFALDGLGGRRILAMREVSLCMELRAHCSPRVTVSRPVSGEVPLSALRDTIRQLLGRSSSLDARVVLSALGSNECIAEVRWYCEEVDPFASAPRGGPFAALAAMHPLDLRAVSLVNPELSTFPLTGPATQSDMRSNLEPVLPDGPWLVFGRRRTGEIIRPRVVPANRPPALGDSALVRAVKTDAAAARWRGFQEAYADAGELAAEDVRRLIGLLVLVRCEHIPASAIDALCAVKDAPDVAVRLLAQCDDVEERAAVLDLQRDFPFLWSATSIESWLAAFGARFLAVRDTLTQLGVSFDVARHANSLLGEIRGIRPELSGHARAVFLATVAAFGVSGGAVDGSAWNFVCHMGDARKRSEIDRLITRHNDGDPPPHDFLSRATLDELRGYWMPYHPDFAEVIAAPFAVAEHAAGLRRLAPEELVGCRDCALYDPEFFEALTPMHTNELLNRIFQK